MGIIESYWKSLSLLSDDHNKTFGNIELASQISDYYIKDFRYVEGVIISMVTIALNINTLKITAFLQRKSWENIQGMGCYFVVFC